MGSDDSDFHVSQGGYRVPGGNMIECVLSTNRALEVGAGVCGRNSNAKDGESWGSCNCVTVPDHPQLQYHK